MKTKISKNIAKILITLTIITLAVSTSVALSSSTYAEKTNATADFLNKIKNGDSGKKEGVFNVTQHPDAPAGYEAQGADKLLSPVYFGIDLFRYFMSAIAVIIFVVQGISLVFSSEEEAWTKSKNMMKWSAVGLILIQLATTIVFKMFFGNHGEVLQDPTSAKIYAEESTEILRNILGMAELVMAAVAVLMIVISGIKISASGGEEDAIEKEKKKIGFSIAGLVMIILSEVVVRQVIFPENGAKLPSVGNATFIIIGLVNYVTMFVGFIAFLSLLYAGYMYIMAGGDDDAMGKVKQIFLGSIIGILLSLGSYAIINTMLDFNKVKDDKTTSIVTEQALPKNN